MFRSVLASDVIVPAHAGYHPSQDVDSILRFVELKGGDISRSGVVRGCKVMGITTAVQSVGFALRLAGV